MATLPSGSIRNSDGSISYQGYKFPGLNKPIRSKAKDKKYVVLASKNGSVKMLHFGHSGYDHNYSESAKKSYLARSAGIKNKSGSSTANDPHSANYWARKILWAKNKPANGSANLKKDSLPRITHDIVNRAPNGQYILYSADRKRILGRHNTRAEAEAQERAIEASKHARGDEIDQWCNDGKSDVYIETRIICGLKNND
jgi:hypothetical protein